MSQSPGKGNTKTDGGSSTIGGGTIVTVQGHPNKAQRGGAQQVGKKTLIHPDIAHYELYMQLQQMKQLEDQMQIGNTQSLETS